MATYTRNFTTTCIGALYDDIQANSTITTDLDQIIQDGAAGTTDFIFVSTISTGEETELDNILSGWTCPVIGASEVRSYEFFADQFLNPTSSDWAVTDFAPATVDTQNSDLIVRRFDDTTEEGVGLQFKTPKDFTDIKFIFRSRPQSAPSGVQSVELKLYKKEIPDGGTIGSWSSSIIGAKSYQGGSTNWIYHTIDETATSLGLNADTVYQLELTRNSGAANDTLSGDMVLLSIEIEMS